MAETSNPPAMDEILASIRRIITEEPPLPGAPAPRVVVHDEENDDVLELGAPGEAEMETSGSPVMAPVPAPQPVVAPSVLVSQETQAASQRALAALSGLSIDPTAQVNTLDGLVRDMLRPMLKDWLDANLPEMVERVVAREVARISGR